MRSSRMAGRVVSPPSIFPRSPDHHRLNPFNQATAFKQAMKIALCAVLALAGLPTAYSSQDPANSTLSGFVRSRTTIVEVLSFEALTLFSHYSRFSRSQTEDPALLWSTYNPALYFAVRPRLPKSVVNGLMWLGLDWDSLQRQFG